MLLPIGMDERRVARWPIVTLTLAALTLGISGSVAWHNHLTHNGTWFESANTYWHEHPDLVPPDGCATYLVPPTPDDPNLPRPRREQGDSRKLAALCLDAMNERSVNQPLWLVRQDKGLLQVGTLTHGLAFSNLASTLVGVLLLVFLLGAFLEDRWGRDRFAVFWVMASLATSAAFQEYALKGAEPFVGGNALSAACMGAFAVTFGKQRLQLALHKLGGTQHFFVPAWGVAILWLVIHFVVLAFADGRTPADSAAELAGLCVGIAAGVIGRLQKWQSEPKEEAPPAPEPTWIKSSMGPAPQPEARQGHSVDPARATPPSALPMFDDGPVAPLHEPAPLFDAPLHFADLPPVKVAPVTLPEPVPLDADGGWARFAQDAPVLAPKVAGAERSIPPTASIPGPFQPPPQPMPFVPFSENLASVLSAPAREALPSGRDGPSTPYWTLVGRDRQGLLLRDEDGNATRLDPRQLLAVALGVVHTVDVGPPGPALIVDLVMDVRPPRCVRLRPTPDALAAGWPGLTRQEAVVALAHELASGGAIRVPQVPEWPGPPWSAFPDTRSLMAAWQQALAKR